MQHRKIQNVSPQIQAPPPECKALVILIQQEGGGREVRGSRIFEDLLEGG